ncbi:MAG: hypothetical protein R2707_02820 [Acidimicrobiales bacterium]
MIPDPDLVARLVARVGEQLLAAPASDDPVLAYGAPDTIHSTASTASGCCS